MSIQHESKTIKSTRAKRNEIVDFYKNFVDKKVIEKDGIRKYVCTYENCHQEFKRGDHLTRHVKSIHKKVKDIACIYSNCHKMFSRIDNLRQHLRVHRNDFRTTLTTTTTTTTTTSLQTKSSISKPIIPISKLIHESNID